MFVHVCSLQLYVLFVSVLEIPNEEYLESLLESEYISNLGNTSDVPDPELIVHMTPQSIIVHPKYQEFMKR